MPKKTSYRTKNWKKYNEALVTRGSLTLWISDDAVAGWIHTGKKKQGRPFVFSDGAIECALTLRAVFRLPLRQTEGFLQSVFALMQVALPVPDYSTLSLRAKGLKVDLLCGKGSLHLLLDSTGLKIRGEGEWRQPKGRSSHRKWRKFHLGIDADTQEIVVQELSLSRVHDATAGVRLIHAVPALASLRADGSYDKQKIYYACAQKRAVPVIPPQKNAIIRRWRKDPDTGGWTKHLACLQPREEAIRSIRKGGRKRWKKESGYHQRSLVETAMSRMIRTFGGALRSKRMARQRTEAAVRCRALNIMTSLGMPETVPVV